MNKTTVACIVGAGQSAVSAVRAAHKACLNKTFSMLERDSYGAEQADLSNMQKVLHTPILFQKQDQAVDHERQLA